MTDSQQIQPVIPQAGAPGTDVLPFGWRSATAIGKETSHHAGDYLSTVYGENRCDAFAEPFGISNATEGWRYYLSQVRDTFSLEQAEPLVDYFKPSQGDKSFLRPAFVPIANLMGASAIPSLPSFRDRSVYKLYLEPGYLLEFKVSAINLKTYIHGASVPGI